MMSNPFSFGQGFSYFLRIFPVLPLVSCGRALALVAVVASELAIALLCVAW